MTYFGNREKSSPSGYELVDVTVYREQRLHELELFLPATQTTKSLLRNLKDKAHEAHSQLEAKALEQVEVSTVTPAAKKTRASNRGEIESGTRLAVENFPSQRSRSVWACLPCASAALSMRPSAFSMLTRPQCWFSMRPLVPWS